MQVAYPSLCIKSKLIMNQNSILLLTKDAQCKSYYPSYGNKYWEGKMPNWESLAQKGTIYNRFYTAAPSSNMSYLSMFTMMYPYQHDIKEYVYLPKEFHGLTFFDLMQKEGYENHIIWDSTWDADVQYVRCYKGCIIHSVSDLRQGVGCHYDHKEPLKPNEELAMDTLSRFVQLLDSFAKTEKKIFLWCHLPHVLNGRTGYGGDMDLYDKYIGVLRNYFTDDNIFISADHGNMNGHKGKVCYGFDVYEPSINIPLLTPKINNESINNDIISNIDIFELILNRRIPKRELVISDSAYYAQPRRKTAFIMGRYVYIYNKFAGSEELYDLSWDPNQDFNLINDFVYDVDRNNHTLACEYYFYPYWDKLPEIRAMFIEEKNKIWRTETRAQKIAAVIRRFLSRHKHLKNIIKTLIAYDKWK